MADEHLDLAYLAGYNLFNDMDGWLNTMSFFFFCLSTLNQSFEINACGDSADKKHEESQSEVIPITCSGAAPTSFSRRSSSCLGNVGNWQCQFIREQKRHYVGRECVCRPLERKQTPHLLPAHSNRMPDASTFLKQTSGTS